MDPDQTLKDVLPDLRPYVDRVMDAHASGRGRVRLVADPGEGSLLVARTCAALLDGGTPRARVGRDIARTLAGLPIPAEGGAGCAEGDRSVAVRAPHHTVSYAGFFGTARVTRVPRPGEVSIAHGGLLYLDEWPHFARSIREHLPRVLDAGRVEHRRAGGFFAYPAQPALVIAHVTRADRDDPRAALPGAIDVELPERPRPYQGVGLG